MIVSSAGHVAALWVAAGLFAALIVVIVGGVFAGELSRRRRRMTVPEAAWFLLEEGVLEDHQREAILRAYFERVSGEELLALDELEEAAQ